MIFGVHLSLKVSNCVKVNRQRSSLSLFPLLRPAVGAFYLCSTKKENFTLRNFSFIILVKIHVNDMKIPSAGMRAEIRAAGPSFQRQIAKILKCQLPQISQLLEGSRTEILHLLFVFLIQSIGKK